MHKIQKGFTLVEILLTIAIIGVLLGVVIITVDPVQQFANARNDQRQNDVSIIALAIEQYYNENGRFPGGIDQTSKEICRGVCQTSETQVSLTVINELISGGEIPIDPLASDVELTGYQVRLTGDREVFVSAPLAEGGESVSFGVEDLSSVDFTPGALPEVSLWLDPSQGVSRDSSGRVSSWQDQSSDGLQLVQPFESQRPQFISSGLNGQPVIRFDGTDDFLTGTGLDLRAEEEVTFVFVTNSLSAQDPDDAWYGGAYSQLFFEETEGNGRVYISIQQDRVNWYFGTGSWQPSPPSFSRPSNIGTNYTTTMIVRGSGGEELFVDGASVLSYTDSYSTLSDMGETFWIGKSSQGYGFSHGDIAEMIILKHAITPTERVQLQDYLNNKYGL